MFPVDIQYRPDKTNTLANGTCCDPSETAPSCVTGCNIYITFCVCEEQRDRNDTGASNCPLGALTTPLTRTGLFTFTAIPGTTTTTTYPVSLICYTYLPKSSHISQVGMALVV